MTADNTGMHALLVAVAKNAIRLSMFSMLSCALAGCMSVMNLVCDNKPYGGVTEDLKAVWKEAGSSSPSIGFIALTSTDLPFSLVADTIALPYTVPSHYFFNVGKPCSFVEL